MTGARLGRTGIRVSRLGLGGSGLGNLYTAVDDRTATETVDAAWTAGVRYFDTAPHYGLGLSEARLGAALAGRPRAEFVLSTKVGRLLEPNPNPRGSDLDDGGFAVPDTLRRRYDYSSDGVRRSLDASLRRLGLDRIDIAYVHDPEGHLDQTIAEALPALVELRDQGVLGAVGAGMNLVEPLRRIVRACDVDVVMIANRWTLLDRSAAPLLDDCAERGIGVAIAAPFNGGLLAQPWPKPDSPFEYAPAAPCLVERARRLATAGRRVGVTLPRAAIQFPLLHPAVATVVVGAQGPEQMAQSARWLRDRVPTRAWTPLLAQGDDTTGTAAMS